MIGQAALLSELTRVVKRTHADSVSAFAHASTRRVFRFAQDAIHQDLAQESLGVTVRVVRKECVGVASTDTWTPEALVRCVRAALKIAQYSPPLKDVPDLPAKHRLRTRQDYAPATAKSRAAECVEWIAHLFRLCTGAGAALAGSLMTG